MKVGNQSFPDFHLGGLQNALEELLGLPVGLVTPGACRKHFVARCGRGKADMSRTRRLPDYLDDMIDAAPQAA